MIRNEKKQIERNWNELGKLKVKTKSLAAIIETFLRTQSWQEAYKKIPSQIREMHLNAYQSYVWNECVKELLKAKIEKKQLFSVSYAVGTLLFYKKCPEELRNLSLQTISDEMKKDAVIESIMKRAGISPHQLRVKEETGNFLKSHERKIIVLPENFSHSDPQEDELNKNKYKIKLSFELPKGSYATILTKRLFGH